MEIQTEQKKTKKEKTKKNKRLTLNEGKINLGLYIIGGGVVGSALFAATTYGAQTVTNISTLIGGLGGESFQVFLLCKVLSVQLSCKRKKKVKSLNRKKSALYI
ncbi:hypothetical protein JG486_12315 [Bacillus mycoides]|nr:hypothetical protein JG486_12315 [Bacillus mycoides]